MRTVYRKLRKALFLGRDYLTRKTEGDEFLPWLMFANAGMQHPGNLYSMDLAIQGLPSSSSVVEVGSFCGLSTNIISYLLQKYGQPNALIATDPWVFENLSSSGILGGSCITVDEYTDFVRESFRRNVRFFSRRVRPHAVRKSSDDFFAAWNAHETVIDVEGDEVELGGGISFAFIDGNHTYDYCRRDFENVDRHLDVGGWILFDDSSDANSFGLTRLMKEIRSGGRYEVVIKNPNYLFKKLKD